ncbi:MAG: hypothetical protein ACE141_03200 [Bryobacteraceae bacterium]
MEEARQSEYRRLRAEYDAAYARLCAEQIRIGEADNQEPFYQALAAYRQCRDRLARFLILRPPARARYGRSSMPACSAADQNDKTAFRPSGAC